MCRLLVYWGEQPKDLSYFLVNAPNSLIKQSYADDTGRPNPDGWGMAYYIDGELDIVKMPNPAYDDTHFRFLARHVNANVLFAHVRRKSYGVVRYENTHPFKKDEWVFMHNGNVPRLAEIKAYFDKQTPLEAEFQPAGETDSEYIFMQLLNRFQRLGVQTAEERFQVVREFLLEIEGLTPREEQHQLALNIFLTNGEQFFAYRRNRTLMYTRFTKGWLLATEATDKKFNWQGIKDGIFLVGPRPGELQFKPVRQRHRKSVRQNV